MQKIYLTLKLLSITLEQKLDNLDKIFILI